MRQGQSHLPPKLRHCGMEWRRDAAEAVLQMKQVMLALGKPGVLRIQYGNPKRGLQEGRHRFGGQPKCQFSNYYNAKLTLQLLLELILYFKNLDTLNLSFICTNCTTCCNFKELWIVATQSIYNFYIIVTIYRVIRNDFRGCNNLSYTIHSRQDQVVAPMDLQVYVPPPPASIPELKVRITTTIETITTDMLHTVRKEIDYHADVCRITKGAYIEHL